MKKKFLGDYITLSRGFDLPQQYRVDGNTPIVSSSGISGKHKVSKVQGPGVVTGRYGTLGKVFYIKEDFWPLNTTLYVADFKGNDPLFVNYFLRSLNFNHLSTSSAVPGLDRKVLHRIRVDFPKKKTQQKIASILSAYDELIENNSQRIKLLEQMAEEIYKEWFVRLRFPGYKETKIVDGVPEGWERKRLKEVTSLIARGITPKYDENGESIVINQKCIRGGKVTLKQARLQSKKIPKERNVKLGDILVNSTGEGTLGRVGQLNKQLNNITVDTHVTIVRPTHEVDQGFLGHFMLSSQVLIERLALGSTGQTELNRTDLGNLRLIYPTEGLREKFLEHVNPMRNQAELLAEKNELLQKTRDLLLPRLISGKLSVAYLPEQEPELMMAAEPEPEYHLSTAT